MIYLQTDHRTEMWVSALLFLALCGGILGSDEGICNDNVALACEPDGPRPFVFPKNAEDLDKICPFQQDRLTCIKNQLRRCEMTYEVDNVNKVLTYVRDVCDKGSDKYNGVVENLPCMKEIIDNPEHTCKNLTSEAMKVYEEHARANNDADEGFYLNHRYCFFSTYRLACFIEDLGRKCGTVAKDIALDAQHRSGFTESLCSEEQGEHLLKLIQVLEIEMEHKDLMKQIISPNAIA